MRVGRCTRFPFSCHGVEFSPFEAGKIAVATAQYFGIVGNGRLHVLNRSASTPELEELRTFDTQAGLFDCAWSECHPRQLVTAGADGVVKLWDLGTSDAFPVAQWSEHEKEASGVDWNLVSKDCFASASWDGTIRLWQPDAPESLHVLRDHGQQPVYGAVWCPFSSSQLLSFAGDGTARVLDVSARRPGILLEGHGGHEVLAGDWDKYRHFVVATGCADGLVRTWDLRLPRQPLAIMGEHQYAVRRIRYSPHPTSRAVVASASYDMNVVLWELEPYAGGETMSARIHRCRAHTEFVSGLAFSLFEPGLLATCGWDRRLCIWS